MTQLAFKLAIPGLLPQSLTFQNTTTLSFPEALREAHVAPAFSLGSSREGKWVLLAEGGVWSQHPSFLSTLGRAMSHHILLLLAMLTLGLAISQRRDQVPCRTVRHSAGRVRGTYPTFVLREGSLSPVQE